MTPRFARALVALLVVSAALGSLGSASAKVVHENTDQLPTGCDAVAGDVSITVRGGRERAREFNGAAFTFDNRSWEFPPCTRVTVTFINEDHIRHQFMVHGAWPAGFFQIEVDGPGQDTGTFILGPHRSTLLVHCGVAQHQQKGMKAEFLIDGGRGHLPNILGISGIPEGEGHNGATPADDAREQPTPGVGALLSIVAAAGLAVALRRTRR